MYDYSKFVGEIYNQQNQFGTYTGPSVELTLISPKLLPTQVLRPYVYSFSQQFQEDVFNSGKASLQEAVAPAGVAYKPSVASAIMPTENGQILNTYELSSTWSFVLVIDNSPVNGGIRYAAPAAMTRFIATGYIAGVDTGKAEEPVWIDPNNPLNYKINPRAVLVFTHSTVVNVRPEIGGISGDMMNVSHDTDIITPLAGAMTGSNNPMFLALPGSLVASTIVDHTDNSSMVMYGDCALSNVTNGQSPRVDISNKNPTTNLNTIMSGLDSALTSVTENTVTSQINPIEPGSLSDQVTNTFANNLPNPFVTIPRAGIDTSVPMTLQQLDTMYPNMTVRPLRIPTTGAWGVSPQDQQTLTNKLSSFLAGSITAMMSGCGISNIAFQYVSSGPRDPHIWTPPKGVWKIMEPTATYIVMTEQDKASCIKRFIGYMDAQVFPAIKAIAGEFKLHCFANMTGEVLIGLKLLDFFEGSDDPTEGFYETNGRLGGITNPFIADQAVLVNNATALANIKDAAIYHRFGPSAFVDRELDFLNKLEEEPVPNDDLEQNNVPFTGGTTGPVSVQQQQLNDVAHMSVFNF